MTMPNSQGDSTFSSGIAAVPVSSANEPSESARGQMRQIKENVMDQAKTTFRDARDKASSSLADGRRQAADQIGGIATAFHSAGEHLRDENQERIAGLADSLAGQVDQVAGYLRATDIGRIARDVEDLARRHPALVFGSAFVLGILGARFLKSSEAGGRAHRYGYDVSRGNGGHEPTQSGGAPQDLGTNGKGGSDVGA